MRESGILLHISSLPSEYGIGDLNAFEFVDFLVKSGQKVWQILPINPTDIAVAIRHIIVILHMQEIYYL